MEFINWAAHRVTGNTPSLEEVAFKQTILAPAEDFVREPTPMLDGMLDRVTGTDPYTTLDDQFRVARGGRFTHAATIAYHLRNAQILRDSVYAGGMRIAIGKGGASHDVMGAFGKKEHFDKGVLVSNFVTHHWFGEWLLDANAQALMAERLGMPALELVRDHPYDHAPRYREIFNLSVQPVRSAAVDELIILQDQGQNADRSERLRELRSRARQVPGKNSGHGVFLVRGSHGQLRLLENEEQAMRWAEGLGFHVVDPMAMGVDEVLAELRDARWVVGVESSTMLHAALVMHPQGAIVSIVPPDRFCINSRDYLQALGIGYVLMVAKPGQQGGFHVDLGELKATLELAQARFDDSGREQAKETATA